MNATRVAQNLWTRIGRFVGELSKGLRLKVQRFVSEMLYGIQASESALLTEGARTFEKSICIKKKTRSVCLAICSARNSKRLSKTICCAWPKGISAKIRCRLSSPVTCPGSTPKRWSIWLRCATAVCTISPLLKRELRFLFRLVGNRNRIFNKKTLLAEEKRPGKSLSFQHACDAHKRRQGAEL